MTGKAVLGILLLVALPTCTEARSPVTDSGPAETELVEDFEFEGYPGNQWYGPDGREIPKEAEIINVISAPDHCGWETATMMHVGKPLGDPAKDMSESDQFIRDPEGLLPQEPLMAELQLNSKLSIRAEFTGYRTEFMELWLDRTDDTVAFLVFASHVERWPRAEEAIACG